MINLSSMVEFHARVSPDRLAIVYNAQRITYADLWDRTLQLAAYLQDKGIAKGDVVGVVLKNSSAFLEIAFATSYLGAVFLPINYRLSAEEIAYIANNAEASLIFGDEEFAPTLENCGLDSLQLLNEAAQHDTRELAGRSAEVPSQVHCRADDLYRLMYTSGTTAHPKGVMHSYMNFYWKCMDHIVTLGLGAHSRLLAVGPLYHVGAFDLPGVAVTWMGGMICIQRDFDPATALSLIEQEQLNCMWLAPVMLSDTLSYPERDKYNVETLQWCIGGGEKTPESRIREFAGYFTNGRYIDAYGLTESCSGDTFMEAGREIEKIGSAGRATPHVDIEIADADGNFLAAGEEGEIVLRGPKVTSGYWNDPEKTAASRFGEWFRTGDIGYLDEEGFLFLTDRKKDMIISGGENIASSEVERVIYLLPQVHEAAVIGIEDEKWGEVPIAIMVLKPGTELDFAELQAHCREHLAGFKVPKQLIVRDTLPRNPSGKILKRVLREEIA